MLYDEPNRLVRLSLATARQEPAGRRTQAVYTITGQGRGARCFAGLMQRDRVLISREALRQGFLEVLAGQVLIGSLGGQADRYSGKVPQPMRI